MKCGTAMLRAGEPSEALRGLRAALGRWWRSYWQSRSRRAAVFMLRALDEKTLHDIGVDRSEIESVVYGEPSERRLCYKPDAN